MAEASRALNKPSAVAHISQVCHGKRQTACNSKWEFVD